MARQERLIRDWFAACFRPGETYLGWGLLSKYPNPTINRAGNAVAAVRASIAGRNARRWWSNWGWTPAGDCCPA
ncbi:MAG: hypothetical protein R2694_07100 [Ilumatobacteraceae bacterium]